LGKIGERFSEKGEKAACFGLKRLKSGNLHKHPFASDSVIRWLERMTNGTPEGKNGLKA